MPIMERVKRHHYTYTSPHLLYALAANLISAPAADTKVDR